MSYNVFLIVLINFLYPFMIDLDSFFLIPFSCRLMMMLNALKRFICKILSEMVL